MRWPDHVELMKSASFRLKDAIKHAEIGEPEKEKLLLDDAIRLLIRAEGEFTGEIVSHEYIGRLYTVGEIEMSQMLARYKRERMEVVKDD